MTDGRDSAVLLKAAGVDHLFDVVVDGNDAERLGLRATPAPDFQLEAARRLAVPPGAYLMVGGAVIGGAGGA